QVGKMTATVTAGLLRFVGGKISKQSDAVNFATPSGNVAVRGGVARIEVKRNTTGSSGARTQHRCSDPDSAVDLDRLLDTSKDLTLILVAYNRTDLVRHCLRLSR